MDLWNGQVVHQLPARDDHQLNRVPEHFRLLKPSRQAGRFHSRVLARLHQRPGTPDHFGVLQDGDYPGDRKVEEPALRAPADHPGIENCSAFSLIRN